MTQKDGNNMGTAVVRMGTAKEQAKEEADSAAGDKTLTAMVSTMDLQQEERADEEAEPGTEKQASGKQQAKIQQNNARKHVTCRKQRSTKILGDQKTRLHFKRTQGV